MANRGIGAGSDQPATINATGNSPRRIGVADRSRGNSPDQPAGILKAAGNSPRRVDIADRTPGGISDQPASNIMAGNSPGRIGVTDRDSVAVSKQPADIVRTTRTTGNSPRRIGIADCGADAISNQTANKGAARDTAANQSDIANHRAVGITEQPNIICCWAGNFQVLDHMAQPVKPAREVRSAIPEWHKVGYRGEVNIGPQHIIATQPGRVDIL